MNEVRDTAIGDLDAMREVLEDEARVRQMQKAAR
jgi:hypothetical protein